MATESEQNASQAVGVKDMPPPRDSSRRWLMGSLVVLFVLVTIGLVVWLVVDHGRTSESTGGSTPASSIKDEPLGTPITLVSDDGQTRLTVTVSRWTTTGDSAQLVDHPQPGNVIALANVKLTNLAPEPATVAFSAVTAIGSDGQTYPALHPETTATIPPIDAMGADFEIPATATITSIQFSLGTGPDSTGRWVLEQ